MTLDDETERLTMEEIGRLGETALDGVWAHVQRNGEHVDPPEVKWLVGSNLFSPGARVQR